MNLSCLSDHDFVQIVAHYNDIANGSRTKISSSALDRGYSPEVLEQAKNRFAEKFSPVTSCNLRFTKPFDHIRYSYMDLVLTLFSNYEKGVLPFPGSASEQPAQIFEIFSVLSALKHEAEMRVNESVKPSGRNVNQNKSRTRR